MTTRQAAEALGINDSRVRQVIRAGELPAEKAGRDWLINARDVERFRRQRQQPQPKKRGRPFKTK